MLSAGNNLIVQRITEHVCNLKFTLKKNIVYITLATIVMVMKLFPRFSVDYLINVKITTLQVH